MTAFALPPLDRPSLPTTDDRRFPVTRIFCIGRNYAAHAAEMNAAAEPIFFMKPAESLVDVAGGAPCPYPADTANFAHEIELVLAIGGGGRPRTTEAARALIWGYAAGVDLTRRDAQDDLKAKGRPWEVAKSFDASAPCGPISPAAAIGHPRAGRIWLTVDDAPRQDGKLEDMILTPEDILIELGKVWTLQPGDLVFTGTPSGVGPIPKGGRVTGGVEGVGEIGFVVD